ncbi:GIY-YIG nuclease family protein [Candidatus Poriferisodalis sp.]|uniref:GIY-YIG nuclease family protein n=1 Tax=Candidatus Poriferisodalis sp. TaxID=3101277 RepID=UPI003B01A8EA
MSSFQSHEDNSSREDQSLQENATSGPSQPEFMESELTRAEMRNRALLSRNSYALGELPDRTQGNEIDAALKREVEDETSIGIAYSILVEKEMPDDERIEALKDWFGHTSYGTAVGLRQHLDALRFGVFPQGPSMARQIAARMNSILRRHEFSPETNAVLERNIASLEEIASDESRQEAEQRQAEDKELRVEELLSDRAGVYVFTYPHYLRHPTHPSTEFEKTPDRTLLKVGFSDKGILDRVNQETSSAGIPEHRRILRAYLVPGSARRENRVIEKTFHDMLDTADRAGPKRRTKERQRGGTEWFNTSLEFLDKVAELMDLEIVEIDASEDAL